MKKAVLGLVVAAGIALVVYADCTDKVISVGSDDANNNSGCVSNAGTDSPCTYHIYDPSIPECQSTTNNTGNICTSTNYITYYTYTVTNGYCNGSGTCHLGTRDSSSCTTNTTPNYYAITCGG